MPECDNFTAATPRLNQGQLADIIKYHTFWKRSKGFGATEVPPKWHYQLIMIIALTTAMGDFTFYPRDTMLARVFAIVTCLSVRLSVCHTPVLCLANEPVTSVTFKIVHFLHTCVSAYFITVFAAYSVLKKF